MSEAETMRQDELKNMIHALRRKGWTDSEIVDHILEIEGDPQTDKKSGPRATTESR